MMKLSTLFSSNTPIDCHILKGRLETEGIPCFIYDEHIIWVHPFRAVAVGGVKLKVPADRFEQCEQIIELMSQGMLVDEEGAYPVDGVFQDEISLQNEILNLKNKMRNDPSLIDQAGIDSEFSDRIDSRALLEEEKVFQELSNKTFSFSWGQFLFELFDPERSIFRYFRTKTVAYHIDKELVENFVKQNPSESSVFCPACGSDNTSFGYAIDNKWDPLYLILSLLTAPLPPIRKKYHCFECGHNFKRRNLIQNF